jgi:hypothetical protein
MTARRTTIALACEPLAVPEGGSLMMEVACRLVHEPDAIMLDELREDFGFQRLDEINGAIAGLMELFGKGKHAIYVRNRGHHRCVSVARSMWPAFEAECEAYWEKYHAGE